MKNSIVIATHNPGKFREISEALSGLSYHFTTPDKLGVREDIKETGETYEANSLLKAKYFAEKTKLPTIADDSGIVIDALKDELGVKTRRWGAGEKATDQEWLDYLLNRLKHEQNRTATFISVITLFDPEGEIHHFRGECRGVILETPQVPIEKGIPLSAAFLPDGSEKVFSAMSKEEKNRISHRGKAIHLCRQFLESQARESSK